MATNNDLSADGPFTLDSLKQWLHEDDWEFFRHAYWQHADGDRLVGIWDLFQFAEACRVFGPRGFPDYPSEVWERVIAAKTQSDRYIANLKVKSRTNREAREEGSE